MTASRGGTSARATSAGATSAGATSAGATSAGATSAGATSAGATSAVADVSAAGVGSELALATLKTSIDSEGAHRFQQVRTNPGPPQARQILHLAPYQWTWAHQFSALAELEDPRQRLSIPQQIQKVIRLRALAMLSPIYPASHRPLLGNADGHPSRLWLAPCFPCFE